MIDPEALRRVRQRLDDAERCLGHLRVTSEAIPVVAEVGRAQLLLDDVSRRLLSILSSPLLLEHPRRTAALTAIVDDWVADRKWWARSTTFESTPIDPVVRMMAADAPTRDALIDSVSGDKPHHLSALLFSATNFTKVQELWLRATDPSSVDPELARLRIEAVAVAAVEDLGRDVVGRAAHGALALVHEWSTTGRHIPREAKSRTARVARHDGGALGAPLHRLVGTMAG